MEEVIRQMQELAELFRERGAELDRRERWDKEISALIRSILKTDDKKETA